MNQPANDILPRRISVSCETHHQWLALRAENVSSTESSALYGLNKYTTEFELWHNKYAKNLDGIPETFRMTAGKILEPAIAELAAGELNLQVSEFKDYIYLPESRMGASFDFMTEEGYLMEIKNVDSLVYRNEWTEESAPDHIEVQVQHCMHVAGAERCYIVALVGGNDLKIIQRDYNPKVGAALEKKIIKFWQTIDAGQEPEIDWERDTKFVLDINAGAGGEAVESTDEIAALVESYQDHKNNESFFKKKADECKAKVLELAGTADAIIADDFKVTTSRTKDGVDKILTITEDMVGTDITLQKGRKGYRQFRVNFKKGAK